MGLTSSRDDTIFGKSLIGKNFKIKQTVVLIYNANKYSYKLTWHGNLLIKPPLFDNIKLNQFYGCLTYQHTI